MNPVIKKILVTGGPVHAPLDAVKILTNRFKGGYMAELATNLSYMGEFIPEVTYLTTKGSKLPDNSLEANPDHNYEGTVKVIYHNGFEDYRRLVLELAPQMDAIILGAAVCNLIPKDPWKGKFPSHQYKVGDVINIPFVIAPRVVAEVKKVMKTGAHLFAFKLLAGVPHEELIEAAYDIVMESGATAVFANDATALDKKWIVTKEHGIHEYRAKDYHKFILEALMDNYYKTVVVPGGNLPRSLSDGGMTKASALKERFANKFTKKYGVKGYVFGTIAVRLFDKDGRAAGFVTTRRGKTEMDGWTWVIDVDDVNHIITVRKDKATLNAPLLNRVFADNPKVEAIVHYHDAPPANIPVLRYAIPGTVRDSNRQVAGSFAIEEHGTFLLLDKEGNVL